MIYFDDFSAYTSVHYGNTSISKVYAGDNQVWPVQPPTPVDYKFIGEYVDGTRYTLECDGNPELSNPNPSNWENISAVTVGDCITSLNNQCFWGYSGMTDVTLPSGLTSIGSLAFSDCIALKNIDIPDGVTNMGDMSFRNCSSLTDVKLPSGLTTINGSTFQGCSSLLSAEIPSGVTYIGSSAYKECSALLSVDIQGDVTQISDDAFRSCSSLESINLPSGLTSIGGGAFLRCSSLTGVTIPDGVTSITSNTFAYCSSLTSLTIGSGVTKIDTYAFRDCSSLTSITIPASVTYIGYQAFRNCSNLSGITCESATPAELGGTPFNNTNNCPIYVPCGSIDAYKSSWSQYASRIQCMKNPYESKYLTIETLEDGNIYFNHNASAGTLNYSLDEGSTWQVLDRSLPINAGDRVMFKGNLKPSTSTQDGIGTFNILSKTTGGARCKVEGNVMSLLFGDNFIGQTDLTGYERAFEGLFSYNGNLFDIDNLKMPATTLYKSCYTLMFNCCSGLTSIPSDFLPATTLADDCYNSMFQGCTSLTTAPDLLATTLIGTCYFKMFYGCSSLSKITCLATNSNLLFTYDWVNGVSATGTFVKNPSMTSWTTGNNGIPSNWTVVDYSS